MSSAPVLHALGTGGRPSIQPSLCNFGATLHPSLSLNSVGRLAQEKRWWSSHIRGGHDQAQAPAIHADNSSG